MKQLSQKYCLISLLEPINEGVQFSWKDWVLHVTSAGVHSADWKNEEMIKEFDNSIKSIQSFEVESLKQGVLGSGKTAAEVVYIKKSNDVLNLHNFITDFLDSHNAVFNNPEWNRNGYIPHSTIQKHAQVPENDKILYNLALVDMFPDGDGYMRKIIKVFELDRNN